MYFPLEMLRRTISISAISQMVLLLSLKVLFSLTSIVKSLIPGAYEVLAVIVLTLWLAGLMELHLPLNGNSLN